MGLLLRKSQGSNLVTSRLQVDQVRQLGNLRVFFDFVHVDREVLKIAPSKGETSLKDHYAHAPVYKFLKSKMVMIMRYLLSLTALVSSPSVAGPPTMITMSV